MHGCCGHIDGQSDSTSGTTTSNIGMPLKNNNMVILYNNNATLSFHCYVVLGCIGEGSRERNCEFKTPLG